MKLTKSLGSILIAFALCASGTVFGQGPLPPPGSIKLPPPGSPKPALPPGALQAALFKIESASRPGLAIVVKIKNVGNTAGFATVNVKRSRNECVVYDDDYCKDIKNQRPDGFCLPPCKRVQIVNLGTISNKSASMINAGQEGTVVITVPNRSANALITVEPGATTPYNFMIDELVP